MARLLTVLWLLRQTLRYALTRKSGGHARTDYRRKSFPLLPPDELDYPTAVATKIAGRFASVVEIGAAGGGRITAIKSAHPRIDALAMDIGSAYETPRTQEGVQFRRYTPSALPDDALVLSVGTLNCMSQTEVSALFRAMAERNCTMLLFEPAPPFVIRQSMRRPGGHWYHPYARMAAAAGLANVSPAEPTWPHLGSLKTIERWPATLLAPALGHRRNQVAIDDGRARPVVAEP